MASSREFALYFLVSLFSCFDHFMGEFDYSVRQSMLSCYHGVHGQRRRAFLFWHNVVFRKKYWNLTLAWETDRPHGKLRQTMEWLLSLTMKNLRKEQGISNTANTRINVSWTVCVNRVWSEWMEEGNDLMVQIIGDSETILQVNPEILNITDRDELNCWLGNFVVEV